MNAFFSYTYNRIQNKDVEDKDWNIIHEMVSSTSFIYDKVARSCATTINVNLP